MTLFNNNLKTPEEVELEHKYQLLAGVKADLHRREQEYSRLKSEIRKFEQTYEEMLGFRIQTLEDLEWQLMGLLGESKADSPAQSLKPQPASYTHFQHITDLLDDDETPQDGANLSLKSLYRGVAKAVHPDLAADEAECFRRQELMALANEAYQTGNRQVLIDLLSEWEQAPVSYGSGLDIALELVRVIRQLAAVRQNIQAVVRQTEELKQSDIYHFKLRVDDALSDGVDLLVDMAAAVDLDIARIRRRLSAVRGESAEPGENSVPFETRIIRFPAGQNCGTLFIRKATSLDFRDWQRIGVARGAKEVFLDTSLRLDVKGDSALDMSFLGEMQPDDLQALFLYGCDDTAIRHITHLTGLQELYLSDAEVTDQGLALLRPLSSLQRLSIYHTAIGDKGLLKLAKIPGLKWLTCSGTAATEEGLMKFRKAKPGCKTVNFKWRY